MKRIVPFMMLLLASPAGADEPPRLVQERGPAKLSVTVSSAGPPPTIRLSSLVVMTLQVAGPETLEVEVLEPVGPAASWQVIEQKAPRLAKEGQGWEQNFLLLPAHPKEVLLKPPALRYRVGVAEWIKVEWAPIPLSVSTRIAKADDEPPRDITAVETYPPAHRFMPWWLLFLVPMGLLAVGLGVHLALRRRPAQPLRIDTFQRASRNLGRLAAVKPTTARTYQRLHFLLAKVLRRFAHDQWGLPALRQTTHEFLAQASENGHISAAELTRLADILTRCDLAKFCPTAPDEAAFGKLLGGARDFVEACRGGHNGGSAAIKAT